MEHQYFSVIFLITGYLTAQTLTATSTSNVPVSVSDPPSTSTPNPNPTALASVTRSSYKEPCNKTLKCDSSQWLRCFKKECVCAKSEEMVYEKTYDKCVSKAGERCTFALDDDEDNNFILEVTGCVFNARCGPEGICDCDPKFYEDSNGTCSLAFGHMEPCETEAQCSRYQALHCQDDTCQCNETVSMFNPDPDTNPFADPDPDPDSENTIKDPQCVGLAGSPCINAKCTDHATCCKNNNTCICQSDFYQDSEGRCILKIEPLKNCSASFQCAQKPGQSFVCIDELCNCDPKVSMVALAKAATKYSDHNGFCYHSHAHGNNYQEENKNFHGFEGPTLFQCVGLVSFPCIDRLCSRNAYCAYPLYEDSSSNQPGTCQCQPGFTESKSHTCATGYETPCVSAATCIDELVCRNSQCLCPFITQTFDSTRKTCLSLIGGPCNSSSSCELRAECEVSRDGRGAGHCACRLGYVENPKGKCDAAHGTECSAASDCDSIAALQCINKKCKCPEFADFSPGIRKCVGLVGAKCIVERDNECVENAFCRQESPHLLPGNCTCNPGFEETSSYRCEAATSVEDLNEL